MRRRGRRRRGYKTSIRRGKTGGNRRYNKFKLARGGVRA